MILSGRLQRWRPLLRWGAGVGVAGLLSVGAIQAREHAPASPTLATVELPADAQAVGRAIRSGGPFAYANDGVIFSNRERRLPAAQRGFYREYTVTTPGSHDRGPRRIVCGGDRPTAPDVCYYTIDHYATFRRITP